MFGPWDHDLNQLRSWTSKIKPTKPPLQKLMLVFPCDLLHEKHLGDHLDEKLKNNFQFQLSNTNVWNLNPSFIIWPLAVLESKVMHIKQKASIIHMKKVHPIVYHVTFMICHYQQLVNCSNPRLRRRCHLNSMMFRLVT